ncbi:MAG: hypothetical protein L0215_15130 [Gemmataceae bacterium]|nr:hypothetical protein [Gemmataceae bacterium]
MFGKPFRFYRGGDFASMNGTNICRFRLIRTTGWYLQSLQHHGFVQKRRTFFFSNEMTTFWIITPNGKEFLKLRQHGEFDRFKPQPSKEKVIRVLNLDPQKFRSAIFAKYEKLVAEWNEYRIDKKLIGMAKIEFCKAKRISPKRLDRIVVRVRGRKRREKKRLELD